MNIKTNNEFSAPDDEFEETKFEPSPKRISTKSQSFKFSSRNLSKDHLNQIDQ